MEKTKVIGKNIGVIALSIIVLIIGGIAENIAKQILFWSVFTTYNTSPCKDCSYHCPSLVRLI